jgi:hypothetical protein
MSGRTGIQWHYTALKVRLGPFDAMVVLPPLLLFAMHIRMWTAMLLCFTIITMWIIELFFHMPLEVALRAFRSFIAGRHRSAVPWWKENKL